jgi:hypothetical protein
MRFSGDTIKTINEAIQLDNQKSAETVIPQELAEKTINFQVNAEIYYHNIRQFKATDSKKFFVQAWMMEREIERIHIRTDSLRRAYLNSSDDQKIELSSLILKAEEKLISLNGEIPALYEKIRKNETEYWQNAPEEDVIEILKRINSYEDSLQTVSDLLNKQKLAEYEKRSDTLILDLSAQKSDLNKEKDNSITYKIQIGAYKGKVPDSATKLIKKLSAIRKIETSIDDKGMTTFTTGNLKAFSEAETMQNQIKQEGVKTPVIVAYQNNIKISVSDAKKINNE